MKRPARHRTALVTRRLWRIAVLAAIGAISAGSEPPAALFYWSDYDAGYYRPLPPFAQPTRPRLRRQTTKKMVAPEKESAKPQGPLIIAISVDRQSLKIYDANGFFA